ncbi:hypothetical protein BDF21DRAFT_426924, partial [Thamnidium elegans]
MPVGEMRGDVIVEIHVDSESTDGSFKRIGDSLHLSLNVDLRDAILGNGTKATFKRLDGKPVHFLQIPGTVLQPGSRVIVHGSGMPIFMSNYDSYGDLHITYNVVFPDFVNIPKSSEDRKVIDRLFMTEKERKARENII